MDLAHAPWEGATALYSTATGDSEGGRGVTAAHLPQLSLAQLRLCVFRDERHACVLRLRLHVHQGAF